MTSFLLLVALTLLWQWSRAPVKSWDTVWSSDSWSGRIEPHGVTHTVVSCCIALTAWWFQEAGLRIKYFMMGVCVGVCVPAYELGGQIRTSGALLYHSLPFLTLGNLRVGWSSESPSNEMRWSCCLHHQMRCWGYKWRRLLLVTYVGSGDLNSGLHICAASTLTLNCLLSSVCTHVCIHVYVCVCVYACGMWKYACMLMHVHTYQCKWRLEVSSLIFLHLTFW